MIIVSAICIHNSVRPEVSKGQPSRSCFDTFSTNGHDLAETMIEAHNFSSSSGIDTAFPNRSFDIMDKAH